MKFQNLQSLRWYHCMVVVAFLCGEINAQRGPIDFYDCSGKRDGNYVHPSDCTKFIMCVAGRFAYEMDCVAGLNYDPVRDRCDYPEQVGCIIDPPTTTAQTTTPSTTVTTAQTTTTTTEVTTTTNPTTTTTSTSAPTPTTTVTTTTSQPSTSTSPVTPIFNCSGLPDGNYKHPTDCSKFVSCVAGEFEYEMECPDGLHFDPIWNKCEYPEIVGCEPSLTTSPPETTTPSPTSTPPTNSTVTPTPPGNSTSTANPDSCDHDCEYVGIDCHNYYSCINFEKKEYHECSYERGLAFNPILKVCDRIENVEGCRRGTSEPPPTTPEEECVCEYRAHETDCSKYYFCSDSCRKTSCEVRTCPGDLLWSVDFYGDGTAHQQCTLPNRANCVSEDSGSVRLEFSCYKKTDGMYRNEHNCHSYWKCNNGNALLYACPKGFIFNPEIKSCDFPGRSLRFCKNIEQIN